MTFRLFLLLNAVLLLRPEDLWPSLLGLHLYQAVIAVCLIATAPRLVEQFLPRALADRPVTACALGFLVAIGLWGAGGFPVWFTAGAALLGVAAMALTMGLPDELHLYRPVFHLNTAWLMVAAVLFLSGSVALA